MSLSLIATKTPTRVACHLYLTCPAWYRSLQAGTLPPFHLSEQPAATHQVSPPMDPQSLLASCLSAELPQAHVSLPWGWCAVPRPWRPPSL